jgi:drug/metabolite transporter (DMT)-like permease
MRSTHTHPTPASLGLSPLLLGCLAATWFVWGSTYLIIRVALAGFAPFMLMATRFIAAGGLLLVWQLARGARLPGALEWRNALIIGSLMLGGGMGGVAFAEQTVPSGLVVSFIAVVPMLVILISLAFKVYPLRGEVLAVGVGLAGVLLLTRGAGLKGSPMGLLAISLGSCGWSLGSVLSQRRFSLAPGATGFATQMLCGGIALLVMSWWAGEPWVWSHDVVVWSAWACLVIFGSLIAFSAYMLLLARTSTSLATSYSLVNPLVALALGVTVGGEVVTPWEWGSASVILAGVVLLFLSRARSSPG